MVSADNYTYTLHTTPKIMAGWLFCARQCPASSMITDKPVCTFIKRSADGCNTCVHRVTAFFDRDDIVPANALTYESKNRLEQWGPDAAVVEINVAALKAF